MRVIFSILSLLTGIYSILIFLRIILSWFGNLTSGRLFEILKMATDPYLAWWKRNFGIRAGILDISVIFAIVALSMAQRIFTAISYYERISLGIVLAIVLSSIWGIASFLIGFYIIVFILRLVAILTNRDMYRPFWNLVFSATQPLLIRVSGIFKRDGSASKLSAVIVSLVLLAAVWIGGRMAVPFLAGLLTRLPV